MFFHLLFFYVFSLVHPKLYKKNKNPSNVCKPIYFLFFCFIPTSWEFFASFPCVGFLVSYIPCFPLSWFNLLFWKSTSSSRFLIKSARVIKILKPLILKISLPTLSFFCWCFPCLGLFCQPVVVIVHN